MLENLFNMQAMLFILIIVGILLYKTGVVTDEGQRCLTDMTLDIIIPCNIITSFMIEMSGEILRKCFSALVVSVVIQIGYLGTALSERERTVFLNKNGSIFVCLKLRAGLRAFSFCLSGGFRCFCRRLRGVAGCVVGAGCEYKSCCQNKC